MQWREMRREAGIGVGLCLVLTILAMLPVRSAFAQPETVTVDIPPQELSTALAAFADQTQLQLLYASELVHGLTTKGVVGTVTPQDAVRQLLEGTGLQHTFTDGKTVTLQSAKPAGSADGAAAIVAEGTHVKPVKVPEVLVKDVRQRETAEFNNLPPDYPGGQVASGGRVGILGNRNIMDTPFTQMNYTSKLIQDQQARFLGEVLRNDPSVQSGALSGSGFTAFSIRGFSIGQTDTLFNGLAIAPTANSTVMTEGIERVEVLRGPNALLNGAAPEGSIGGMVNLVPKRAGDDPLTRLTAQYLSDTQGGGHIDIARRFGTNKQFGVRINGAYRNGNLSIDHVSRESAMTTIGLDYRGDAIRLSADFGYQEQDIRGARRQFNVASGVTILPEPPDTRTNANQPWEFNRSRALYGTVRGEVDVNRYLTAFADFGITQDRRQSILLNRQITSTQGTLAAGNVSSLAFDAQTVTFNVGLRGVFDTGPIRHQAVAAYTQYSRESPRSFVTFGIPASNIYNPVFGPAPPSTVLRGYGDMMPRSEVGLSGVMVGDTLSILDERVQLTAGFRFQQNKLTNFNETTGAVTSQYDKRAITPMVGLVLKPWQRVSLYGSYIEGLQSGPTAPLTAVNAGEIFAPFVSKGYEAGVKVDFGRIATTLAGFQITQPSAFINPATNVFGVDGEQRNRGVEFSVFGEVTEGLRLLGGTTYIDAELTKTQGGINAGNRAPVLPFQLTFYGEWDAPFLKTFTMTSRVIHASSQYVNQANTLQVPNWTQWDLGARYRIDYVNGKPITFRAWIENLLDTNAWYGPSAAGPNQIILRDPRTFLLSATVDF